jgi:hypothetical protein
LQICLTAFLSTIVLNTDTAVAQKNSGSGEFTIKATFDTWWLDETDPGSDYKFSATGAIRDKGTFDVSDYYEDESGKGWYEYTFSGDKGTFRLDHVPSWALEDVEYPVELLPGTGAFTDAYGVAILTAQIRYRSTWYWIPGEGRWRYTYPVVTWTIDGVLIP